MCNFSDDISEPLAPFKYLLKKGQKFEWNDDLQATFEAARRHLTSTKTLAFYRPDRKTRLITDASRLNGIGFVLKQEIDGIWKPVQAGSRFLTETEGRYAMEELELLAICWAAKKCANFIDGLLLKLFKIWTDHAPLIPILNKYTLPEIENKQLQRLRAKLDHLQFHAVWIKGSDNTEADVLSRILHHKAGKEDIIEDETMVSVAMIATVDLFEKSNVDYTATPLRDERPLELRQHQDHEYKMLKTAIIKDGWPERKIDLAQNLEPFWSQQYNLSVDEDGFIVKE
jgi:hypothetical protein